MRRWMSVLAVPVLLAGCNMKQDLNVTGQSVDRFHQMLDAGQFAAIADGVSPEFKAATPAPTFVAMLNAVHTKLGKVKSDSREGFNDNVNNGLHTMTVTYATQFERGAAQEVFLFRINGGTASLASYNINSPALITN